METVSEVDVQELEQLFVVGGNKPKAKIRKLSIDDKQESAEVIYYDYQPEAFAELMDGEYVLRRVRNPQDRFLYTETGGVTVCVVLVRELGIGGIGVAVCSDSDLYSRKVGHPVAFKRAVESLVEGGRFDVIMPSIQGRERGVAIANVVANIHNFYTNPPKKNKQSK